MNSADRRWARRKRAFAHPPAPVQKLPDGQITQNLSSPARKNFLLALIGQISGISPLVSPEEGRLAIVTKRTVGCGGRRCATDERGRCGRRSRVGYILKLGKTWTYKDNPFFIGLY
jgi:hypothetical protein